MKKTAVLIILVFGLGALVPYAAADDDVLKKMRAFKAVMDKLPESTREDEPEPPAPAALMNAMKEEVEEVKETVEPEPLPWEREAPADNEMDSADETEEEDGTERWTPYQGYTPPIADMVEEENAEIEETVEEVTDEIDVMEAATDMDAVVEQNAPDVTAEVIEEDLEAVTEEAEDIAAETIATEMSDDMAQDSVEVIEEEDIDLGAEMEEEADTTEWMDISADADEDMKEDAMDAAESVTEDAVEAPAVVEESSYEWNEDAAEMPMDEDAKEAAEEIRSILQTGITAEEIDAVIEDAGLDMDEPADEPAEETVSEEIEAKTEPEMNISEETPVAQEDSAVAAARPRLSLDQVQSEAPEIMKYRQDLSRELTPEMIEQHAHIDKIKSEIDADIDEIHADIELITGIKREVSDTLAEE